MSVLREDLQIWNNGVFDNGCDLEESESYNLMNSSSCSSLKKFTYPSFDSFSSSFSKENQSPSDLSKSPVSVSLSAKSPILLQPLQPSNSLKNHSIFSENLVFDTDKTIDEEIEQIENEINQLSSKLELLKLKKTEQNSNNLVKQKRVVAAKFMESTKQSVNGVKKIEEPNFSKIQRRGFSMGPNEIIAGQRSKFGQLSNQEIMKITPIESRNRRKSCFWKLQDIEEENEKEKVLTLTLSPKSRKPMCKSKTQVPRQAFTSVGSKIGVKKDDGVLSRIQPKNLFSKEDGERSVGVKKQTKTGRVIASRYNQSSVNSATRKRSLPENYKDETKKHDKKCNSSMGKSRWSEGEGRKKWDIAREILVAKRLDIDKNEKDEMKKRDQKLDSSMGKSRWSEGGVKKKWENVTNIFVAKRLDLDDNENLCKEDSPTMNVVLPKIRAIRFDSETPRDSGPAKRVAELVGRKSFFSCENEQEDDGSICQSLTFVEDFENEN